MRDGLLGTGWTRRSLLRASIGSGFTGLALARSARAEKPYAAMALILAVDVSYSIDDADYALQRRGLAAAFRHQAIHHAIESQPAGSIAALVMEWADEQSVVVPWRLIQGGRGAEDFATAIDATRRSRGGGTAIGDAIARAAMLMEACPYRVDRRVIDVSGDGANNRGSLCSTMRDIAVARGITVNGLAIESDDAEVVPFYEENVVGGPGSFLIIANGMLDFASAIRGKLIKEVAGGFAQAEATG